MRVILEKPARNFNISAKLPLRYALVSRLVRFYVLGPVLVNAEVPSIVLEDSAAPAFICDATGTVRWSNSSFAELFPAHNLPVALGGFLGPGTIRRILSATHFTSFQVEDATGPLAEMRPCAIVIGSAQADPDRSSRLVVLQCVPSLESGVKDRQENLAAIAHDLKNPLGAIFGYADILLDTQVGNGLNERQRDLVLRIRNTSLRSIDLVRNYQYLVSLRDAPTRRENSSADLNEVVRAVVDSVWRQGENAMNLRFELSGSPVYVCAEPMELERVVANLFSNAIKYTPVNGEIVLSTGVDEGTGIFVIRNFPAFIPPGDRQHLFECFNRGGNAGDVAGTGLGLYIVKEIVERCAGQISLESSQQDGTIFSVKLPGATKSQEPSRLKK